MYYGMYVSAAGAHALGQKVEVLSNNLANVDTSGFKRELALFEARDAEAIERGQVARGARGVEDVGGGVRMRETATDWSLGTLKQTGIESDLALDNPSDFFLIQHNGEAALTRAGNFSVSPDGRWLTQSGDPLLAADGTVLQIDPGSPFRVLPGGVIETPGDQIEIGIRRVAQPGDLVRAGDNTFTAPYTQLAAVPVEERRVFPGMLESSAVQPTREMVDLIATSRAYEANVRMIQHHDGMMASLVNRALRQS
jgi:flagellar basal-body rod protein FlgF/flagellar basal-body rod protein FlgG